MLQIRLLFSYLVVLLLSNCVQKTPDQKRISVEELSSWSTYGKGTVSLEGNELILSETDGSDGYFLISPEKLPEDFILRYEVKPLSESSVLIALFSVNQGENSNELVLPAADASPQEVWDWRSQMKHYNLTFNNSSHGINPFFFKNLNPNARGFHQWLPENIATVGAWHEVEIGKENNKVWFKLNGQSYFEASDSSPLAEGYLMLRISGTSGENPIYARASFRNLTLSY